MFTSFTHNWFGRLWHSFMNWMSEPISFPGMLYDLPLKQSPKTK